MIKNLEDFEYRGKKVLLRCDFNVPLADDGEILNDFRIKQAVPTIEYLIKNKARVIIITHLGDPDGKVVENLRLNNIAKCLSSCLSVEVSKTNECLGERVEGEIEKMKEGEVLLLENIRFYKEEEASDEEFAQKLSQLGDIYINDAFGVCHRSHASVVGIPKYLPSGSGFLLAKEIKVLSNVLENPWHPLVVIVGGVKIETKVKMIERFLKIADHVLIGGAIANTILIGKDIMVGFPLPKENVLAAIGKINLTDPKIHLPVDGTIVLEKEKDAVRQGAIGTAKKEESVLDIGSETVKIFKEIIGQAKMIVWNGPMGLSEDKRFERGTREIAQAITRNQSAFKVVGGGETIDAISKFGLVDKFDHVSTGGGAMLDFLSGENLPGIKAIDK